MNGIYQQMLLLFPSILLLQHDNIIVVYCSPSPQMWKRSVNASHQIHKNFDSESDNKVVHYKRVVSTPMPAMFAVLKQPEVLEVDIGQTATILCPSNDNQHRFQFWQLKSDSSNDILGPANKLSHNSKYRYAVLDGTLYIRNVSPEEHGTYTCYCRHLLNTTFYSKSVILVVKSNWKLMWNDDNVNLARMGLICILLLAILLVIFIIRNHIIHDKLMRFQGFQNPNESIEEVSSRRVSFSLPRQNSDEIELTSHGFSSHHYPKAGTSRIVKPYHD